MKKRGLGIILSLVVLSIFAIVFASSHKEISKDYIKSDSSNIVEESQNPNILIAKKEVIINVNDKLPSVDSYFELYDNTKIKSIKYYLGNKKIDSKKVISTTNEYMVELSTSYETYKVVLKVIDDEKPMLELKKVEITEGEKYTIKSFVRSCTDNSKNECKLNYTNDNMKNYNKPGTYNISIIADDKNGNKIEKNTRLIINAKINSNTIRSNSNKTSNKAASKDNSTTVTTNTSLKYKTTFQLKNDAIKLEQQNTKEATEILNITNKYRKEKNVGKLKLDKNLSIAANVRALEIAIYDKFDHYRPNGKFYSSVLNDLNINAPYSGENIAYGYIDSGEVCEAWKNSKGHYENIISSNYTKLGVGVYTYNNRTYWVQIFSS